MKKTITLLLCAALLLPMLSGCSILGGLLDRAGGGGGGLGELLGGLGNPPGGAVKQNDDGSIDLAVKAGEAGGFVYAPTGDSVMMVDFPEGAFDRDIELNMAVVTSDLEGIVAPGFLVTDRANPGAHVELLEPATVMLFCETELPRDVMIVKFNDDMTGYEALPSVGIATDSGYFIFAEMDSFSGAAPGREKNAPGGIPDDMDSLVWRIEGQSRDIRVREFEGDPYAGNGSRETADSNFYLRLDSRRVPVSDNNLAIPRTYTGLFDSIALHDYKALYAEGWAWEEDPPEEHLAWRIYDSNLTVTMIPKLKYDEESWKEWWRKGNEYIRELENQINELNGKIERGEMHPGNFHYYLNTWRYNNPPPAPPKEIFDGYIGWGTAHISSDIPQLNAMIGAPLAVPVILRVKGASAKVTFTFPFYFGTVEMQGTFKGVGVAEAAAPPDLKPAEALKYEYNDKPEDPPDPPTGNPGGELKESAGAGNTKIQLPGGGWIRFIRLFPAGGEDEEDLDAFYELWDTPPGGVLGKPKP